MKRLLIAHLLITLLFGCSNKNEIVNLRCIFDEFKGSNEKYFEEFQPNDNDRILITFNKNTKEGSYYSEREKGTVHNFQKAWLSPELITLEKSDITSWYSFYETYKISRINGQITLYEHRISKTDSEKTSLVQIWKRGDCYVPNEKPLF